MSRQWNSMDIDITQEQLDRVENRRITQELIQDITPELTPTEREFLISGYSVEEQKMLFGTC